MYGRAIGLDLLGQTEQVHYGDLSTMTEHRNAASSWHIVDHGKSSEEPLDAE